MTEQLRGIRNPLVLGGKILGRRDPIPIGSVPTRYSAISRTAGASGRIDRLFLREGQPNNLIGYEFSLPWRLISEPGLLSHLDSLEACGQIVDFVLWKQDYQIFDGDGTTQTFWLRRRQAMQAVTPRATFEDYATVAFSYDKPYWDPAATETALAVTQKSNATIDAGSPSAGEIWIEQEGELPTSGDGTGLWWTKIRTGDVLPHVHDCFRVVFIPIYAVAVATVTERSYAEALAEGRGFKLTEVR